MCRRRVVGGAVSGDGEQLVHHLEIVADCQEDRAQILTRVWPAERCYVQEQAAHPPVLVDLSMHGDAQKVLPVGRCPTVHGKQDTTRRVPPSSIARTRSFSSPKRLTMSRLTVSFDDVHPDIALQSRHGLDAVGSCLIGHLVGSLVGGHVVSSSIGTAPKGRPEGSSAPVGELSWQSAIWLIMSEGGKLLPASQKLREKVAFM
jgi:hypothetical protein